MPSCDRHDENKQKKDKITKIIMSMTTTTSKTELQPIAWQVKQIPNTFFFSSRTPNFNRKQAQRRAARTDPGIKDTGEFNNRGHIFPHNAKNVNHYHRFSWEKHTKVIGHMVISIFPLL